MKPPSEPVWKNPRTVLITGATGGIGSALALAYAAPDRTLILHGRDQTRLSAVGESCRQRGARVLEVTFELRDSRAAIEALGRISRSDCPDLVFANAGITRMIGRDEEGESFDTAHDILAVNLEGALATIAGVLPEMRRRGSGQIALMSSLAAYYGLPRTPAYSASKAALKVYGEALRPWLAPYGIAVSVILPQIAFVWSARIQPPIPRREYQHVGCPQSRCGEQQCLGRIAVCRQSSYEHPEGPDHRRGHRSQNQVPQYLVHLPPPRAISEHCRDQQHRDDSQ